MIQWYVQQAVKIDTLYLEILKMMIWLISDIANVHETDGVWVRLIFAGVFPLLLDIFQDR